MKVRVKGMREDLNEFDLKEVADAFSEMIEKTKVTLSLPKFSELDNARELAVYMGGECAYTLGCTPEVMDKEDLLAAIHNGEMDRHEITVYLAEKHIAQFSENDIRDMVESMMESAEQYEDWDEAMMADIHDSAEVKAFLAYMNGLAESNVTYQAGLRVEMDGEGEGHE